MCAQLKFKNTANTLGPNMNEKGPTSEGAKRPIYQTHRNQIRFGSVARPLAGCRPPPIPPLTFPKSPLPARMAPSTTSPSAPAKPALLGGVAELDAAVSLRLHALFLPVPRLLLKALEVAGDGRIWLPVPISLLLLSASPANASGAVSPLLAGLVAGLVIDLALVKVVVRRPRPAYNAKDMYVAVAADHWSFPSGHSSRAFLVAAFLSGGGFQPREALFLWAAATSASRVLLGRHYVLDVVAGAFLGVFEAWLSSLLLRFMCAQSTFLVC